MFIYVIGTDTKQKIGYSKDVSSRLSTIQTGNPEKLNLHHSVELSEETAKLLEHKIHSELRYKRIRGEWFKLSPTEAKLLVDFAVIRWADDYLL